MIKDPREIRKDKILSDMRKEMREIAKFKKSPEGKRAFVARWIHDNAKFWQKNKERFDSKENKKLSNLNNV